MDGSPSIVEAEAHRPSRVTGRVDGGEGHAGTADALAVVEAVDQLRGPQVEALEVAPEHAARADRVEQHVQVVVVDAHVDLVAVLEVVHQRADAADVVDVPVRVEEGHEPQPVVGEPLEDRRGVGWGVDQDALAAGPVRRHEPAVGLGQPERATLRSSSRRP